VWQTLPASKVPTLRFPVVPLLAQRLAKLGPHWRAGLNIFCALQAFYNQRVVQAALNAASHVDACLLASGYQRRMPSFARIPGRLGNVD
jgi:hypothetical protein